MRTRNCLQPIPKEVVRTRTDFSSCLGRSHVPLRACLCRLSARFVAKYLKLRPQALGSMVNVFSGRGQKCSVHAGSLRPLKPWDASGGRMAYDLIRTGWDFIHHECRDEVKKFLKENPPDLLILCPPCTHEGGWFNLNATKMTPQEYLQKKRLSRMFIRFCCELFENQVQAGKQALFEHPPGAKTWPPRNAATVQ